ncbi:MAG: T9SS type A sorting domain-containing protein [Ignavibacteria bacterium]|nr:T9SS type A sorting domain-containing protein [Ignavibacteria bacterium]
MKNFPLSGFSSSLVRYISEKTYTSALYIISQTASKLFCLSILILLLISETYSQTFTVNGNITTTDSTPVKYASITFIDQSDSTKKYFTNTDTSGNYQLSVITNLKDETPSLPQSFELMQNYPNPFSEETNIPYKLNEETNASVTIYNILGQAVKSFKSLEQAGGMHGVTWDGRDEFGKKVSTGVYFYRLLARGETQVKKMIYTVGGGTNAKLAGGVFSYQGLKKERMGQPASGMYTIQIANTETTRPKILFSETSNVILQQDTTIDFQIEKGIMAFSLCYEKWDSSTVDGDWHHGWDIYLNNITGTNIKDITVANWNDDDYNPTWSPDGKYIAYRRDQPSGVANLYLYDTANDTCVGLIVSDLIHSDGPNWTPDSKKVIYQYRMIPNLPETHIINVDGTNDRSLGHSPAAFYLDNQTYLYVDDSGKVYKTNIDNSFDEFIIDTRLYGNIGTVIMDFNTNSEEILFSASVNGLKMIRSYSTKTKTMKDLLVEEGSYIFRRARWSNDFSKIVIIEADTTNDSTHTEHLAVLENGIKRRLVKISLYEQEGGFSYFFWNDPLFSPDGKYIAYAKLFMESAPWVILHFNVHVVEVETGNIQMIDKGDHYNWNPMKPH